MDINRFSQAEEAISAAQSIAARSVISKSHRVSASLFEQEGGLASSIASKAGINPDGLKRRIEQELERMLKVSQGGGNNLLALRLLCYFGKRDLHKRGAGSHLPIHTIGI